MHHGADDLKLGLAGKRRLAGEHFVENGAETPEVRAEIDGLAGSLFGGHVERRAAGRAIDGDGSGAGAGEAEIDDAGDAVLGHDDVAGLDIAVEDAVFMGLGETGGDLPGNPESFGKRAAPRAIFSRRVVPWWYAMAMNRSAVSSISWTTTMLG